MLYVILYSMLIHYIIWCIIEYTISADPFMGSAGVWNEFAPSCCPPPRTSEHRRFGGVKTQPGPPKLNQGCRNSTEGFRSPTATLSNFFFHFFLIFLHFLAEFLPTWPPFGRPKWFKKRPHCAFQSICCLNQPMCSITCYLPYGTEVRPPRQGCEIHSKSM